MPAADSFVDTNVLLYAISTAPAEQAKASAAQQLLVTQNWAWSAQVAAEFVAASTSSRRPEPLTLAEAAKWIDTWSVFPMTPIDGILVKEATRLAERYQISYYDAQIIAAAKRMNCGTLWTEDLNDGQDYDGVIARNPFQAAP